MARSGTLSSVCMAACAVILLSMTSGAADLTAQAQPPTPVALELVLAIDTSTSVDEQEFRLQRNGIANAFRHPDVIAAIEQAGGDGLAVTLVQWSGPGQQRTTVGWTLVRDAISANRFAESVSRMPRLLNGFTDIGGAIRYSAQRMQNNSFAGLRRVIDISGDGTSNATLSGMERDRAVALGATVNGLVIYNEEYDLGELAKINLREFYEKNVIGGTGAFLMTARDFEDFQVAMRKKLVREIVGPGITRLPSLRAHQRPAFQTPSHSLRLNHCDSRSAQVVGATLTSSNACLRSP